MIVLFTKKLVRSLTIRWRTLWNVRTRSLMASDHWRLKVRVWKTRFVYWKRILMITRCSFSCWILINRNWLDRTNRSRLIWSSFRNRTSNYKNRIRHLKRKMKKYRTYANNRTNIISFRWSSRTNSSSNNRTRNKEFIRQNRWKSNIRMK